MIPFIKKSFKVYDSIPNAGKCVCFANADAEMDVGRDWTRVADSQFPEVIRGFVVPADYDGQHRCLFFSGVIS